MRLRLGAGDIRVGVAILVAEDGHALILEQLQDGFDGKKKPVVIVRILAILGSRFFPRVQVIRTPRGHGRGFVGLVFGRIIAGLRNQRRVFSGRHRSFLFAEGARRHRERPEVV